MGLFGWIFKMGLSIILDFSDFVVGIISSILVLVLGTGFVINIVSVSITMLLSYIIWKRVGLIVAIITSAVFFWNPPLSAILPTFVLAGIICGFLELLGKRM